MENLWEAIGNKCLQKANEMLNDKTAPVAGTIEAVKELVGIAISIDMLTLRWAEQTRFYASGRSDQPFLQQVKESSIGKCVE